MRYLPLLLLVFTSLPVFASMDDDPLLTAIFIEQLEWREDEDLVWDGKAWIGYDRDKLLLKTEGERADSKTEEFEAQLLYDRAVTPYWDLQVGWRGDFQPETRRSWFALGVAGLAPGFIETELTAFLGDGRSSMRLKGEHKLWLSQHWLLVPKLETNWFSDADPDNERGDGLTDLELSLRLHYAIRPDIKPYVGLAYTALFGDTGDFAEEEGERDRSLQVLAGLKIWF